MAVAVAMVRALGVSQFACGFRCRCGGVGACANAGRVGVQFAAGVRLLGPHPPLPPYPLSTTLQVLQRAQAAAEERIRCSAVQAMAALTAPELGPAVIGTAAAVVAEVAAAAAEQRLRAHVPSAVRRAATEQLQQLLAVAARGGWKGLGAHHPAAAEPAAPVAGTASRPPPSDT